MIQFSQPENESAYGVLAPRDTYHRSLPAKSVDIYGIITRAEHSNPMSRDEIWSSSVFFPMNHLLPIPNHFLTSASDMHPLADQMERCFSVESQWFGDDIADSFGPSRLPPTGGNQVTWR